MATNRKLVFANDQIYHVFNRGVEKRPTFTGKRELNRALLTLGYYHYADLPIKLSKFLVLSEDLRSQMFKNIKKLTTLVDVISFCLMPNHFHFLLKQNVDNGVSNFTNSYTRYFNTKHERVGPLFQGTFKAVRITSDEQLIHVSRYIHLNPVSSFIIEANVLEEYLWSSYIDYIGLGDRGIVKPELVTTLFGIKNSYKEFVLDQVDYARKLEGIKHLALE
jgi:putative transposase